MRAAVRPTVEFGGTVHEVRYERLAFWCPGCEQMDGGGSGLHLLPIGEQRLVVGGVERATWTFDGNLDAPTLSPSILTRGRLLDPGGPADGPTHRCHSFLRAGVFEYLDDCTHPLAGQFVELPELPDWCVRLFT